MHNESSYNGDNSAYQFTEEINEVLDIIKKAIQQSRFDEAKANATHLLGIATELDNSQLEGIALDAFGQIYLGTGDFTNALQNFEQALSLFEISNDKKGKATAIGNIGRVYRNLSEYRKSIDYYRMALALDEELGNTEGMARHIGNIGNVYLILSDYLKALENYQKALVLADTLGNQSAIAKHTGNIGIVYLYTEDYKNALIYFRKSLDMQKELGEVLGVAVHTGNIAGTYFYLKEYQEALVYYQNALDIYTELQNISGMASAVGNIGLVKFFLGDYSGALLDNNHALTINYKIGNKEGIAFNYRNIGSLFGEEKYEGYESTKSEAYLLKSIALSKELGLKMDLYYSYQILSELYSQTGDWQSAYEYHRKYHDLEKEVQSDQAKESAERLAYERKETEREKQHIAERAASAARIEEQERLIHNMLPPDVANRLLNQETFIADHFDSVSVLFMDIVNFTPLSSQVPPRSLVYLLDCIFTTADSIMKEFGIEKIKTIGDAYMAVCGAPVLHKDHAFRTAQAALALVEAMNNLHINFPAELGDTSWTSSIKELQVRIGLHTGEAVGGVIGTEKFAYDFWGDAVNTASRMESHGESGKIHVSDDFRIAVETCRDTSLHTIEFIPRGEMNIKGKGMMKTYFLERPDGNG